MSSGDLASATVLDLAVITDMAKHSASDFAHPPTTGPDLADTSCDTHKNKDSCAEDLACYWGFGKCRSVTEPVPNCSAYSTKDDCVIEDGCSWQQVGPAGVCVLVP